jgi:hypothetical protein
VTPWENPIVASLSLDIEGDLQNFTNSPDQKRDLADTDASLRGRAPSNGNVTVVDMPDASNYTVHRKRAIPADFADLEIAGAMWDDHDFPSEEFIPFAWHLALLTPPWAQKGLTGQTCE